MSTTTKKILILALIFFIMTIVGTAYLVYAVHNKEQALQTQINMLAEQQQQEESFFRLQRIAEESKKDREILSGSFLAKEGDSIDFLTKIETLAAERGLSFETKGLDEKTEKGSDTRWIEISMTFSGEPTMVEQFISILENLPYISTITELEYKARSKNDWEASLTMQIFMKQGV
jgi:hypothetical protein